MYIFLYYQRYNYYDSSGTRQKCKWLLFCIIRIETQGKINHICEVITEILYVKTGKKVN